MKRATLLTLAVLGLGITMASCGASNDACDGFACDTGFSCLIENGSPTCVPDGDDNGGGSGQVGDACETNSDCQTPLTCKADLNGDTVCSE